MVSGPVPRLGIATTHSRASACPDQARRAPHPPSPAPHPPLSLPAPPTCRSPDGTTLFVCSIDGYVSAISLGGRDTGEPLHRDDP